MRVVCVGSGLIHNVSLFPDDSTLSKSMTIMAGSSQLQSHRNKSKRDIDMRSSRSKSRGELSHHHDTESDTSASPINEFSNMPTYRIPTKSRGGTFCLFSILI